MKQTPAVGVIGLTGQSVFFRTDQLPREGETSPCDALYLEAGGKGHNQAIACKRMGVSSVFVGAVGDDSWGIACKEALMAAGVVPALTVYPGETTAYAAIAVDKNGRNQVLCYTGAGMSLRPQDIRDEAALRKCGLLLAQLEMSDECVGEVLSLSKRYGIPAVLNPAPARPLKFDLLAGFYALTPNEHEARVLFGVEVDGSPESCAALFGEIKGLGLRRVAVTMGDKGVLAIEESAMIVIPPLPVEAVVDTTGAGDTFNGALAARLSEGATFIEAVKFSVIAAGLSVCKRGVVESIPTRDQVDAWRYDESKNRWSKMI